MNPAQHLQLLLLLLHLFHPTLKQKSQHSKIKPKIVIDLSMNNHGILRNFRIVYVWIMDFELMIKKIKKENQF